MDPISPVMRPARLDDAERIADYHHACRLLAFSALFDETIVQQMQPKLERWRSWLADGSDFTTVVAVDGDDVPFGHVTVRGNVLAHLFIDPPRHRQGFGRTLLAVGEQLICDAGHAEAELQTRVGNDPAIALYASAGWVMTDEVRTDEDDPGVTVSEHVLRKTLAPQAGAV
ncbi:MAG: GNAT family N-acetyltransferase [Acidimicrobiales bacterium]|nr:GNAT family N-acetyltransferase [Acidimicrobiales bacterium]